ncbi:MAG: phosphotransferase [Anaerolineales bacterium]
MTFTIEHIVERIPDWQNKSIAVHPLSGGLTNTNYRLEVGGTPPYVVRIPGASTELLAVDRQNEYHNTLAAAQAGVGPRIVHYLADANVMVLEFIHGRTMSIPALKEPGMPTRMAQSLKKLHAGPRFLHDFNMFRLIEFYLKVVDEHAVRIPGSFRERMLSVGRIEQAMLRHPLPGVPCHNDLLAENYIDDGEMLWIVDYEYSGNNDPTFELGNTCQEQQFDEPRLVEMCAAYFGEPYPDKLARMKLNMIMSDVGWTLWAAIQAKISTIEYDFWGWAVERWARAEAKMDSAEFEKWLEDI